MDEFRRARDAVQALNADARAESTTFVQLGHADVERAVIAYEPILPGWALFPVQGKIPPRGLAWTEHASADAVERAALAELPHDGWAVACGPSGLCVIDLDRHDDDADGIASWCAFLDAQGLAPADGNSRIVGATPSGGRHLYYAAADGIRNRVGILPGVDVRAAGGYAVLSGPGRMLTIHDWALPPLPTCVLDLLTPPRAEPTPRRVRAASPRALTAALEAACDLLAAADPGRRNDLLNWAAYTPGREAVAQGASAEIVTVLLLDAARACGLSESEALATINSGLRAAA